MPTEPDQQYFWCTTDNHGDRATLDRGGHYERIDDSGTPVAISTGGVDGFCGFATSDVPEVCMSKSPEACLFAVAHNESTPGTFHVYWTDREPDVDVSSAAYDFAVLEEVRYRNPQDEPVPVERYATVDLPTRALDDASESYNPHGPHTDPPELDHPLPAGPSFHEWWARAVKEALAAVLSGDSYPDEVDAEDPDAAYYAEFGGM